jgi:DNA-binding HxlR family transcriptional regulator
MLVFLSTVKKAGRFDLIKNMKASQPAIYNALRNLLKLDLIKQVDATSYPYRKDVSLTDKGKKVVALLTELVNILLKDH